MPKNCTCHVSYKTLTYHFILNSDYNPLSKSSLCSILVSIKPSKRKSLGGLDNLIASGINGFELLIKLASKYRIETTMTEAIQNGKRYLKTNYQMHCNTINYSQLKSHNLLFALSDPNNACLRANSDTSNNRLRWF